MTTTQTPPLNRFQSASLSGRENPQLDERIWKSWIEKNEKRDNVKFARRVRVMVIAAALIALAGMV